jgi:thiol:disulfide interchange protein
VLRQVAALSVAGAVAGCSAAVALPATVEIPPPSPAPPEPSASPGPAPPRAPDRADDIAWESSEPAARARAERAGLPMIVWVRAEWAVPVIVMERSAWRDPRVVAAARRFVALRLDVTDAGAEAEAGAKRYDVTLVPMTVLIDAKGRRAATLPGMVDAETLAAALAKVAP